MFRIIVPISVLAFSGACKAANEPIHADDTTRPAFETVSNSNSESEFKVECSGRVEFVLKDGLMTSLQNDMVEIAKVTCRGEIVDRKSRFNITVNEHAGPDNHILNSAEVEYKCADGGKASFAKSLSIPDMCTEVFNNFSIKQR